MRIKYIRWDGKQIMFEVNETHIIHDSLQSITDLSNFEISMDSSAISVECEGNNTYVATQASQGSDVFTIKIDYDYFVSHAEEIGPENAIVVDSLESYISALEYYRVYSLKTHIILLFQHAERAHKGILSEDKKAKLLDIIEQVIAFFATNNRYDNDSQNTDRIQAQAGSFIICGLDEDYVNSKMNCSRRTGCMRLIIKNKRELAKQLNAIGINDTSIIPDMAHHAGYMKRQLTQCDD